MSASIAPPSATIATVRGGALHRRQLAHAYVTLGLGAAGLVGGLVAIPRLGVTWLDAAMLGTMYALTMTGVAVGFHNLFSHRAFRTSAAIRVTLAILGSMAGQGPVVYWATNHRLHHGKSDEAGDMHSPWVGPDREAHAGLRGFWHSHVGWMFTHDPANPLRFSKDLLRDTTLGRINGLYYLWVILGLVLPSVVGFALDGTRGLWSGIVWGGLARMCLVQHATFAGNSVCHLVGEHTYDTGDRSTNVWWLTIPTWGGAMHNTHHAFPSSPVVGFAWWHFDIGGFIVRALVRLGLASEIRVPTAAQRSAMKRSGP